MAGFPFPDELLRFVDASGLLYGSDFLSTLEKTVSELTKNLNEGIKKSLA